MAKASTSKRATATVKRSPSPDDSVLNTDSEVDEFAQGYQSVSENEIDSESESGGEEPIEGNARWEPDDWDAAASDDDQSSDEDMSDGEGQLRQLQSDLTSLPLSTLAKAQKTLRKNSKSGSTSESNSKEDRIAAAKAKLAQIQNAKGKGKAIPIPTRDTTESDDDDDDDSDGGPTAESSKRTNKHAPTAMSTKKQVSRSRQVVDVYKPDRRDPRFSNVSAGQVDVHLHSKSYPFLPDMLKEEFKQLKKAVSVASKAERTCPWAEKPARTAEKERLEGEMGRLRTKIARAERETREREALQKVKKEEKEKRAQGKGAWYMKKAEKRDLLLKARFDALEDRGGKTAVKKALEKKRRKIASKEKKSRPFARGQGGPPTTS